MKKIFLTLSILYSSIGLCQPVKLDSSYNFTGIKQFTFNNNIDRAFDLAIQPDQKIVIVGLSKVGQYFQVFFTRFNTDGTLDNTFGSGGTISVSMGQQQSIGGNTPRLRISADGKITGINAGRGPIGNSLDMMACRLDSNGIPDNSFGGNGSEFYDMSGAGTQNDQMNDFDFDANGNFYGVGVSGVPFANDFAVIKVDAGGNLVNSFDTDGRKLFNPTNGNEFGRAIRVLSNGKILIGGNSGSNMYVFRIDSTGTIDNTFNNGLGGTTINFGNFSDMTGMEILSDGRFVVAGTVSQGNDNIALARFNSDGTPDISFGTNGKAIIDLTGTDDIVNDIFIKPDGKILVAGQSNGGASDFDFFTAQIDTTGLLDASFNATGFIRTSTVSGNVEEEGNGITLMNDGRIMMVGTIIFSSAINEDCSSLRWVQDTSTGLLQNAFGGNNIMIFPNPVSDFLQVNCFTKTTIAITDLSGKVISQHSLNEKENKIYLSNLKSSVYFMKDIEKNTFYKFIKM